MLLKAGLVPRVLSPGENPGKKLEKIRNIVFSCSSLVIVTIHRIAALTITVVSCHVLF